MAKPTKIKRVLLLDDDVSERLTEWAELHRLRIGDAASRLLDEAMATYDQPAHQTARGNQG